MRMKFGVVRTLVGIAALSASAPCFAQDAAIESPPERIVQDYEPTPAIWKLADEDTTIYLFGTFHVLPEGFRWRSAQFDRIVEMADELIVETSDEDLDKDETLLVAKIFSGFATREPMSKKIAPDLVTKWGKLAEFSDMPVALMDRFPPILTLMQLAIAQLDEAGSSSDHGVETVLEAEFATAGKPVGSIEDGTEVFDALLGIDEDLLIPELETALREWDGESLTTFGVDEISSAAGNPGSDWNDEHLWAQGKDDGGIDFGSAPFSLAMKEVLLSDRNRAWAGWLEERLATPGTLLVAVGAGHLSGDVSLQKMLEERGLRAERLP